MDAECNRNLLHFHFFHWLAGVGCSLQFGRIGRAFGFKVVLKLEGRRPRQQPGLVRGAQDGFEILEAVVLKEAVRAAAELDGGVVVGDHLNVKKSKPEQRTCKHA